MDEQKLHELSPAGLYIHIPYCKRKCSYCCFHFSTNLTTRLELLDALYKEISIRAIELENYIIQTIYLGGGTPSLLSPKELIYLLDMIRNNYRLSPEVELTLEANPDDLTQEFTDLLFSIKINRLSIGIQSIYQEDLEWMNRAHTAKQSREAIEFALTAGFTNLSVDLMYGLPGMTPKKWKHNLEVITNYQIPHFSAYALTLEERTALAHFVKTKQIQIPPDDETISQMNLLLDFCEVQNFEAYEISNFSKPGNRSKHNCSYWEGIPYLGFGPSAHSYIHNQRRWNVSNNNTYINALQNNLSYSTVEFLSLENQCNEYIMLQLRRIEGIDLNFIASKFPNFISEIEHNMDIHLNRKHIQMINGRYNLTRLGKSRADAISSDLFIVTTK